MKTLLKSALIASAIFAAAANAATVSVKVSDLAFTGSNFDFAGTLANAQAAETAFLSQISGIKVVEDFESPAYQVGGQIVAGDQNQSWIGSGAIESGKSTIHTKVGTFVLETAGQGSSAWNNSANAANNLLLIESAATGEFGRQSLAAKEGHWLDSNDAKKVVWTLGSPLNSSFNAFGFYLSDSADVAGKLTLTFADQTTASFDFKDLLANSKTNGNIRYVSVISDSTILNGKLTFDVSVGDDGWGIDDITVGTVPEPGSILLMGLGLLGLGAARRRIKD